jgi:putative ABC transport system substrate-binding protein
MRLKAVQILSPLLLWAAAAGCSSIVSATAGLPETAESPEVVNIGIIQFTENLALDAARQGFLDTLKESGYSEGQNLTVQCQKRRQRPQ